MYERLEILKPPMSFRRRLNSIRERLPVVNDRGIELDVHWLVSMVKKQNKKQKNRRPIVVSF